MNRGELWWFELPDVGRRPGLILTRQAGDGMPTTCVLSFDNLLTVLKALLTRRFATLAPGRTDELCRALRIATGC